MSYSPFEKTSEYSPPSDLISVEVEAKCQTDVVITLLEPKVKGTMINNPSGFSWTGVKEVTVKLRHRTDVSSDFEVITNSDGIAEFKDVPCGNYRIYVWQMDFVIKLLDSDSIIVSSSNKKGTTFDLKIRRQLGTVEVFRLPTLYMDAIEGAKGKEIDGKPNDPTVDAYGHHWVKIYKDSLAADGEHPMESYGWWPIENATADKLWGGVKGNLNGFGIHSLNEKHDPYHTRYNRDSEKLDDVFFPYVTNGRTAEEYKAEIRAKAVAYAQISGGIWSWRGNDGGYHCKTFQTYLMREVHFWKRLGVGIGNLGWSANTE